VGFFGWVGGGGGWLTGWGVCGLLAGGGGKGEDSVVQDHGAKKKRWMYAGGGRVACRSGVRVVGGIVKEKDARTLKGWDPLPFLRLSACAGKETKRRLQIGQDG